MKVYTKMLLTRLEERLDRVITPKQAGFRRSFLTSDNIITLKLLLQKTYKNKLNTHLVFLDFKKAFDLVSRKHIWMALRHYGIEEGYIKSIN
uniref:Reverse transcriptase domain-containing protein n=1 Tax=Strongyloides stercoralis TaxID=6248 RepID=A0A0K0EG26_STRER